MREFEIKMWVVILTGLMSCVAVVVFLASSAGVPLLSPDGLPREAKGPYTVQKITDGDTLTLKRNGEETTLRLIGMDTPETVGPGKPVECFRPEASAAAMDLLDESRQIYIETDPSLGETDRDGHTLAYLWLGDWLGGKPATLFNQQMISNGYAHEYTHDGAYKYQADFQAAEQTAQSNQAGVWSPETCNANTD